MKSVTAQTASVRNRAPDPPQVLSEPLVIRAWLRHLTYRERLAGTMMLIGIADPMFHEFVEHVVAETLTIVRARAGRV